MKKMMKTGKIISVSLFVVQLQPATTSNSDLYSVSTFHKVNVWAIGNIISLSVTAFTDNLPRIRQ